jgi:hypothetical protein
LVFVQMVLSEHFLFNCVLFLLLFVLPDSDRPI